MTPRNITTRYYALSALYTLAAALIWGVNTLFLLDAGLEIFEAFLANAAFTAGSVVFEIPTGVLADTRGRRMSFLLSVTILMFTTLAYVGIARAGGGLIAFSAVSVVMGLGFTFYSGAVEAWLVDALNHTGFKGGLDSIFARGSMITGAAMLVGTVSGGLLGQLDLALPFVVRAALLGVVFVVAFFTMHDIGFTQRAMRVSEIHPEMRRILRESLRYGWNQRALRLIMLCSFFQWGFLTWGWYAWQPYFLGLLGQDAVWVAGVVAALMALSTIVGNAIVDWLSRYCGRRTTLLLWAAGIQMAAAIGVGLAGSFAGALTCFLVVTAAMGVARPVKQAYLHQSIPSAQRASVVSFDAMVGNAGGVVGQTGLGYLSRVRSIADGYVVGGVALIATLPILFALRRIDEPSDRIVGRTAGHRGSCAPQGIPEISQVEGSPPDTA